MTSTTQDSNPLAVMSVTDRQARDHYDTDEAHSHIHIHQDVARATGAADILIGVCPARVYSRNPDGTIAVEYAACFECGACLAVAPPGSLDWVYPEGGHGIQYREG